MKPVKRAGVHSITSPVLTLLFVRQQAAGGCRSAVPTAVQSVISIQVGPSSILSVLKHTSVKID